jgi:hypothetical protein
MNDYERPGTGVAPRPLDDVERERMVQERIYTILRSRQFSTSSSDSPSNEGQNPDRHAEKGSEADAIFSKLKSCQILDWTEYSEADWRSPDVNKAAGKLAEEIDRLLAS